jgi:hypothetical protein
MPPEQGGRRHEKCGPSDARQKPARRGEEESVGRPKCRPTHLSPQDGKLMAQHHNLEFFELSRSEEQTDQLQDA